MLHKGFDGIFNARFLKKYKTLSKIKKRLKTLKTWQ